MSKLSLLSPEESFRSSVSLRNRRRRQPTASSERFWLTPKFRRWKDEEGSSLLIIKSTFRSRFTVKDFCVNAIEIIRESGVPVLWALKTVVPEGGMACDVSSLDILKSLVSQALRVPVARQTESFMAAVLARIGRAGTAKDWLSILGSFITPIREIVIIVDWELLTPALDAAARDLSMPVVFLTLFRELAEHNAKTTVKVILVSYGSSTFSMPAPPGNQDLVLVVGKAGKHTIPADRDFRGASNRAFIGMGEAVKMSLRQVMTKRRSNVRGGN
jgi:hypothetical protein